MAEGICKFLHLPNINIVVIFNCFSRTESHAILNSTEITQITSSHLIDNNTIFGLPHLRQVPLDLNNSPIEPIPVMSDFLDVR